MGGATRILTLLSPSPLLLHRHRYHSLIRLRRLHNHQRLQSISSLSHLAPPPLSSSPDALVKTKSFKVRCSQQHQLHTQTVSSVHPASSAPSSTSPPWPEWSQFLDILSYNGYFTSPRDFDFTIDPNFPEEFSRVALACLAFARHRPSLLWMLSRKDIQVVVENVMPHLFKNGDESVRRMRLFLESNENDGLSADIAHTVDLMKFLLSYASNFLVSSEKNNLHDKQVESSVRNLLGEFAKLSYCAPQSNHSGLQNQFPERSEPTPRRFTQNIEMKRGDWICTRCSFLNFARNMKCLECEEARPKAKLTGGEWECPQCAFCNFGRNMVCLRCDCKRPGEVSFGSTNPRPTAGLGSESNNYNVDLDSRLAVNEEKAQRWFSKVSQVDSTSDMSSAVTDEDFPEIMPLRKGVNRFVVSTRKTPLERRLEDAQYRRNLGNEGIHEGDDLQTGGTNKNLDQTFGRRLDDILGRASSVSASDDKRFSSRQNTGPITSRNSDSSKYGQSTGSNSDYVPPAPSPVDRFVASPKNSKMEEGLEEETKPSKYVASQVDEQTGAVPWSTEYNESEKPINQTESNDQEAEKSDRWFKKLAELHNVKDIPSAVSDEDFPEKMPMRKGENRFVLSKNKDRSLTSPMIKRRMAMEQANNTNYVPFVPFPPGYFDKKDNQQTNGPSSGETTGASTISAAPEMPKERVDYSKPQVLDIDTSRQTASQQSSAESWISRPSGGKPNEVRTGDPYQRTSWNPTQNTVNPQNTASDSSSSGYPRNGDTSRTTLTGNSPQSSNTQNVRESWTGKSLEGSAVKEPDPLDMSEEAKAERWFRRVAQIKDISELSQIPDEDFPSIMPMRKGVNRFVVSKRKTPLERRLTSTQYRKNLPIISSDPLKKGSDDSS
ncbi:zinc finger protein VAR3 chloroplastic [Tripterygium wilfordii]|uniref:Zinc finger protein VAR3 chloroplastic n=1 Tax=Tripterygium wilfordii TaxID=458696 RepID=A0A7J7BVA0_TRIWF|nr:zinc finger protein VAR3, chloroplastic [Tripterygium wilfordii]KAF5725758.1 zinc finger protein VAR3 chloroplastic [Tripterygium wilfordii]